MISFLALLTGFGLDCLIGDPAYLYHPVRLIGLVITKTEQRLRKYFPKTAAGELIGGIFLVITVSLFSILLPLSLLILARTIHPLLYFLINALMCWQILALKSLKDESMKVADAIAADDVEQARYYLSMIVGRDTKVLTKAGIIRGAVETVAENTSDGIIAPLLFLTLGGPVAGFFYKGINTMDSMVGYKNERYLYFGRAAARFDDFVNFIPARLSAFLMIIAAFFLGYDYKGAFHIFWRDRKNHQSPNSAQTEAACAGALGIRLAGDAWYGGVLHKKPFIGDNLQEISFIHIAKANHLLYVSAFLMIIVYIIIQVVTIVVI